MTVYSIYQLREIPFSPGSVPGLPPSASGGHASCTGWIPPQNDVGQPANCSLRLHCPHRAHSASPASLLQAQVRSAVSPAVPTNTEGFVSLLVITECLDVPDPVVRHPTE